MAHHTIVLIPGDGIGPEVTSAACRVMEAAGLDVEWVVCPAGAAAVDTDGDVLPERTVAAIAEHRVALKGPVTTPIGKGFASVNVRLRKRLNLYAAVRPVRSLAGVKTRYEGVDLVIVRENTEGLYSGIENEITPGVVTSLKVATEVASTRIARFAFDYARTRGRTGGVAVFHKANIMKLTDGLFLDCARRVREADYPDVPYREVVIDAGCMRLVRDPTEFDVLLMENLYGDLVSDLCAGLVGGLGVVPGSNLGEDAAVFEAVHGSAPDIAGQDKANPLAVLMSGAMMLNHLGETAVASRIKAAYDGALAEGDTLTADLGGTAGTRAFADALIRRMG